MYPDPDAEFILQVKPICTIRKQFDCQQFKQKDTMDVFQQQGQLDYVAMSNSIISSTVLMAQRLAAAGISEITHQAGLAMSIRFRLGEMGHIRVSDALKNLRPYYGFERTLWFGFGHKSFLSLLTEHQAGFNCAALCASLAEVYGVDRSAQFLQALWRVQGMSEALEPSRSQFRALVNGCSGLLVATPFPDVVSRMAGPCKDESVGPIVAAVDARAEDWAKAVNAVFQVSRGNLKAIKIYGGRDLAFIAAIAYWLFDLRVWIELPDGTIPFSNCRTSDQAEVCLHYAEMETSDALLKISSTTFVLRSIEDLIVDDRVNSMTIRIPWKSCLSDLFEEELDRIVYNSGSIGGVLGGLARIYEAIRKCEPDVAGLSRTHFICFGPAGHGSGFIDNVCKLFPQIDSSQMFRRTAMENYYTNVPTCAKNICNSVRDLTASCGCSNCGDRIGGNPQFHSCHVAVCFFIATVARTMAHVEINSAISPSRNGLDRIYIEALRDWGPNQSREDSRLLELASGLPHIKSSRREVDKRFRDFLLDGVLQRVSWIFVGPTLNQEFGSGHHESQCTAMVKNGVCMWIDALRDLSTDAARMATIHVAPGQIVYKDWSYASIWDLSHASEELLSSLTPANFGAAPTTTYQGEPDRPHNALHILVQERAESGTIRLVYGIDGPKLFERTLQPGIITEEVLMATARVPCPHGPLCSDKPTLPCWQRRSGWQYENLPGPSSNPFESIAGQRDPRPRENYSIGLSWNVSSPIGKLLAIEGCRKLAWYLHKPFLNSSAILVRSDQCMACMTRYIPNFVEQASWEHILYYQGKLERSLVENGLRCSLHII